MVAQGNKFYWMRFMLELPLSLEELYLSVHGESSIFYDESIENIAPVWRLGTLMFTHLRRLRACDICAWIPEYFWEVPKEIPSHAIHWRRLPCTTDLSTETDNGGVSAADRRKRARTLWTSEMDNSEACETRRNSFPGIYHSCHTLELKAGEGKFEGEDASCIWWDEDGGRSQERVSIFSIKGSP